MKSWNNRTNKDCFGNGNPSNIDHVWPISMGGANIKENKMRLSQISNASKSNKTKGKINGIKFGVVRAITQDGKIYGRMQIRKKDGLWEFIEPVL